MSRRSLCLLFTILLAGVIPAGSPAAAADDPPKLLGRVSADDLGREPYAEWFQPGYAGYEPSPAVLDELRRVDREGLEVAIFFGTWCGDSRREVPRMLKLLDRMEVPPAGRRLVAVDNTDELLKRSPGGEEKGLEVYRVPTIVVRRGGREISRIVEYPARSLERDLLAILEGHVYQPSYASYPVVRRWLEHGLLADPNVSARGLADEVRSVISTEGELAAAAGVLLSRGDVEEAVKLYEVNCALYRESSRCRVRLAEALMVAGDVEQARAEAQRAMELNQEPEQVGALTELLKRTLE